MIDKLTPKFLDKSSDYKLVRKTSLIDALNIYIDTETGDDNSGGVIKPIKGTEAIPGDDFTAGVAYKALGSVTDQNTGVVYFFVWSSTASEHGVWAYDHRGVLPYKTIAADDTVTYEVPVAGQVLKILTREEFNFPRDGFVKGDIVYSNTREFENHDIGSLDSYPQKDALLYFTDNKNEPRKINVYRALLDGSSLPQTVDTNSLRQIANDFISACPRVPLKSITFSFESDETIDVNNFATSPGFQFAYQNIYKDGLESAISPYSDIAFPPSIVNRGASSKDNILAHNKCVLRVPAQNQEVEFIKILARYGNGANFIEIDEVDNTPGSPVVFDFYNDRVAGGVSPQTVDKTFDNLPQRAQAQAVASNRIAYGNYVEGYDNVDCSGVTLTPEYRDRPVELLDYVLNIKPSIEVTEYGHDSIPSGYISDVGSGSTKAFNYGKNKTAGFEFDVSQFADTIGQNTKVRISFSMSPDKNFHVYTMGSGDGGSNPKSYHQSRQVGPLSLALPGYTVGGITSGSAASGQEEDGYGSPAYQNEAAAGKSHLINSRENYFGYNWGVGNDDATWENVISTDAPNSGFTDNVYASSNGVPGGLGAGTYKPIFGSSAANPLIIQGGSIPFSVEFVVNTALGSGARGVLQTVFEGLLEGRTEAEVNASIAPANITVVNVDRVFDHEIDLGIQEYAPINASDAYSYLICGVAASTAFASSSARDQLLEAKPPSCAFIVNKATARFYLEKVRRGEGAPRKSAMFPAFRLCLASVDVLDADDIMTCVRDLDPASPWWPVKPSTINSGDFVSDFVSIVGNKFNVPDRVFWEQPSPKRNFVGLFPTTYSTDPLTDGTGAYSPEDRVVGETMFGYMNIPADADGRINLLGERVETDGYVADEFKYSLLDGEGGPGGSGAGQGTAYDALGNDKYGSVAGQCFVGFSLNGNNNNSEIPLAPEAFGYNVYTAFGNQGGIKQSALSNIKRQSVANALGLGSVDGQPSRYRHRSVLTGPYYTGKIVMNTVAGDNPQLANVNPTGTSIPSGVNMSTCLPMVWWSSWSNSTAAGSTFGNFNYQGNQWITGQFGQNSFPYPIVQPAAEGGGGVIDGEFVQGTLVDNPFDGRSNGESFNPDGSPVKSPDYSALQSHVELRTSRTSIEDGSLAAGLSFKSSATHELGIVYYDERGRHGYVNPIGSVYVKGYSEQDRGTNLQGPAFIKASGLNDSHSPPSWAKTYKFVYTKNTSIDKFVQYSAGGAFVANSDYDGDGDSALYVSLNYLQGHPISYSDSYGARGRDNTPVLYSFTPGDRMRVISYMTSQDGEGNIVSQYPTEVEFEVTGLANFDDNDNPFAQTEGGDEIVTEAMKGLFVVLKNNEDASGFRKQDIEQGVDFWGNNCIFEIYSSVKELDADDRLYYEIGDAYNVVLAGDDAGGSAYYHEAEDVVLTQGDVFFRRHAVNLRDYKGGDGFVDLLSPADNDEETFAPESNFKNFYLESEAATDLFPSRAISIGRPNVVQKDSRQSFREASIVHSDRDIVEARKIGYSSFNRSIPSDMEIDFKAGPINYMSNHQDSVFFVQKNKCGHIPVDRNLISDTSGTSSLIASSKFLGTPRYYAGQAGCDDNPESVVDIDNTAYFAHKSLGKVFKVNGANGVNVISDKNMSTFIKNAFDSVSAMGKSARILGGYDPRKKEYLLTISENDQSLGTASNSDILDSDVFEPISISGNTVFDGPDVDVVLDPFSGGTFSEGPSIIIDWTVASSLSDASWNIVYSNDAASADDGSDNILEQYSSWRSSPNGTYFSIDNELELRVTVNNAHEFTGPQVYEFSLNDEELTTLAPGFEPISEDVAESSLLTQTLNDEALVLGSTPFRNTYDNAFKFVTTQLATTGDISYPDVQFFDTKFRLTIDPADFAEGDPSKVIKIPVRFLADTTLPSEEAYEYLYALQIWLQGNGPQPNIQSYSLDVVNFLVTPFRRRFFIGNVGPIRLQRNNLLKIDTIEGDGFKRLGTPGLVTNDLVALNGLVTFQTSSDYQQFGIEGAVAEPFNPCNPYYGYWRFAGPEAGYVLQGGSFIDYLSADPTEYNIFPSDFGLDREWRSEGFFDVWFAVSGIDIDNTTVDWQAAIDSVTDQVQANIGTETFCRNINYGV